MAWRDHLMWKNTPFQFESGEWRHRCARWPTWPWAPGLAGLRACALI